MKKTAKSKKRQAGNPRRKVARAAQRQIRGGLVGGGDLVIINPPSVTFVSTGEPGTPPTVIITPGYIATPGFGSVQTIPPL